MVLQRLSTGRAVLLLGLMTAVLGGCGQKGKLYLPDEPPPHTQNQADCRTPNCAAIQTESATVEAEDNTGEEDEKTEPMPEETTE